MAWIESRKKQEGGTFTPTFSETVIATNNNTTTVRFTDNFRNYDLVKVKMHNVSSGNDTVIITLSSIIDNMFSIFGYTNFNEIGNNQYVLYRENGLTWNQSDTRNCYVSEVTGMNCTNASVIETTVFQAQNNYSDPIDVTYSEGSYFDFDLIFFGANANRPDEVQPCNTIFSHGIIINDSVEFIFNKYNSMYMFTIKEHVAGKAAFASIVGVNFR